MKHEYREPGKLILEGGHTVQEIADTFGVSRPTIYRHLAEHVERA
ncbi:helix-turn-helix domain-containing protein [Pseudoclavibacter sp. RFBG4]|nr:helix-turn-helix domain-containing protein [Pseudoclavibacter sp. RFBG4]